MEFIFRNYEEGEEAFIDYGEEWEAAWDDHLKKWKLQAESGTCEVQSESTCAQDCECTEECQETQ